MNGFLVIDKPSGMTSRDVVNHVQKWFPRNIKIGHAGTLDPLATGVLVICVGQATRLTGYVQAMGKSYTSCFRLGATSPTDDADGPITQTPNVSLPTREQIDTALAGFVGVIQQIPPAVSALKVKGRRAHNLVRQGKDVQLTARPTRIDAIRVRRYEWPFVDVEIDCGKGTYIRSIARDLGAALGCGGLVQTLRRTRIGCYRVENAVDLDCDPATLAAHILPPASALLGLPVVHIDAEFTRRFRQGQVVPFVPNPLLNTGSTVVVKNNHEEVIGVGMVQTSGMVKPTLVLAE